jgi:nitric oxide reductase subunit B
MADTFGELKLLRNAAVFCFILTMGLLLIGGYLAANRVAPVPDRIVRDNQVLSDGAAVLRGQDVFHRYALMDHGSIWGIGTYRAMDFSADTLHRVGQWMRDYHASPFSPRAGAYAKMSGDEQAVIDAQVIREIKRNCYDPSSRTLTLTPAEAFGFEQTRRYWEKEFGEGDMSVGFLPGTVPTAEERRDIADFFFWTAWVAGTNRPGLAHTYTNNWPCDATVGNGIMSQAIIWSILSILALLGVLGIVIYVVHRWGFFYGEARGVEAAERLMARPVTPSQRATAKFFLVAALLFLAQIFNGGLLANYTVRPAQFYVQFIGTHYSYSWAKTWHVQLAILWIATAWVGTAAYVAPMIAGGEPKRQRALVNILFWALVAVVGGSLVGEAVSIKGGFGRSASWFWVGNQGWEYLELGRVWQFLLFGGLIYWLVLVYRTIAGVVWGRKMQEEDPHYRSLVIFYVLSAILVVAFFGFGLFYGKHTHMTIADYWRWFVVHIWVESIFEFFGVAVIALFLVTLGLVTARSALRVAYLTAILVFLGGIPGVAHHYFWFGGPSFWLAIGGVFSSLEPIPLILLVVRGWMEYRAIRTQGNDYPYRWPLYFLVASSVWNFLGAAVFGFIINLPVINYYEHGTYMTANHAHTALFGVYGMLAIALMLFSWRGLVERRYWDDRILGFSFWSLNIGLTLMFLAALLPIGLLQIGYAIEKGYWYARSGEFYALPAVKALAEARIVPDSIVILFGAMPLLYFLLRTYPHLRAAEEKPTPEEIRGKAEP